MVPLLAVLCQKLKTSDSSELLVEKQLWGCGKGGGHSLCRDSYGGGEWGSTSSQAESSVAWLEANPSDIHYCLSVQSVFCYKNQLHSII